ncbi:MAG TPA: hypothetical protein VEG29_04920, partial [Candidatus Binatia bacterium]|nr:hypothetical protein [Candidatus Binatia bacterium]
MGRPDRTEQGPVPAAAPSPAVPAPSTPGSARVGDPLAAEVRLLGALLGEVIAEQAGRELFDLVEGIRRRVIATRQGKTGASPERAAVRERVLAEARGNPLALLELPLTLVPEAAGPGPVHDHPVSTQIERGFLRRIQVLAPDTQRL